jgi:hypothetical protein
VKDQYSTYLCKHDRRPVLTFQRLRRYQNPVVGAWSQWIDVHSAIRNAEKDGYKIPKDMADDYDKWLDGQIQIEEIDDYLDKKNKKPSWLEGFIKWFIS